MTFALRIIIKRNYQMKRIYFIPLLLCFLLAGCNESSTEERVHSVLLTRPEKASTEQTQRFPGIVREASEINVGFKTPGQIRQIAVDEGDYVRKGQLIATLDDADYQLGVEALQVQYEQLSKEVKRLEQLYKGRSISVNDYEKAVAGLKQLGVQLQVNRNKLDYTRLYAPVGGYVRSVNFEESEMVDAGTPVISLLDVNGMEVEVDVPAAVYRASGNIDRISCRSVSQDGNRISIPMKMLSLTPKADATQLYRLRLGFDAAPGASLTAGMNVETEIRFAQTDSIPLFALPLRAVFQEEEGNYVWAVGRDSIIYKVKVDVLEASPSGRVFVSGLQGDESVVRAGVHALQDGEKVRVIAEESKTNVGGLL